MAKRQTITEQLTALAIRPVPTPFDQNLAKIAGIVAEMQRDAAKLGSTKEFSLDGRFLGDLGEIIAHLHFGVSLHPVQQGGQDGKCSASGKSVEVKLRSKSENLWFHSNPDFVLVFFLCPRALRWGVVCNGPADLLLQDAKWNAGKKRFETTLSKLRKAQCSLPPGSSLVPETKNHI